MIRLSDSILLSRVDDEAVLLDADSSTYYGLNPVGSRMLQLLSENADQETVIRLVAEEFDAAEERVRQDLSALVKTLLGKGFVKEDAV